MQSDFVVPGIKKTAVISDCGRYRYELTRVWEMGRPLLVTCMLNPSTADADNDDPTIRALIHCRTRIYQRTHRPYTMAWVAPTLMNALRSVLNLFEDPNEPKNRFLVKAGQDEA
ncbi:hypothetical protein AJ87_05785 [Rhizobium yanglingense]|nr:hypothetical protein AJ87_05785 [Rhizobium yanglingense]